MNLLRSAYGPVYTYHLAKREAVAFRKQSDPSRGLGIPRSIAGQGSDTVRARLLSEIWNPRRQWQWVGPHDAVTRGGTRTGAEPETLSDKFQK